MNQHIQSTSLSTSHGEAEEIVQRLAARTKDLEKSKGDFHNALEEGEVAARRVEERLNNPDEELRARIERAVAAFVTETEE